MIQNLNNETDELHDLGEPWKESHRQGKPCIEDRNGVFVAWVVDGRMRARIVAYSNAYYLESDSELKQSK